MSISNKQLPILRVIIMIVICCGLAGLFSSCADNESAYYAIDFKGNLINEQGIIQEHVINDTVKIVDGGDALSYITFNDDTTMFHKYDIAAQSTSDYNISSYLTLSYYGEQNSTEVINIADFCCYGDTIFLLSDIINGNRLLSKIHLDTETAVILDSIDSAKSSVEVTPNGDNLILEERSDIGVSLFIYHIISKQNILYEINASNYKTSPNGKYYSYMKSSLEHSSDKTIIVKNTETEEITMKIPIDINNGALEEFGGYAFNINSNSICYLIHEQRDSFWDLVSGKNQQPLRTKCYSIDIETGNSEKIYSTKWGNRFKSFFNS